MSVGELAVQLYSVAHLTESDMIGTLERVAEIGYPAVELAGYGDSDPHEIRATLDRLQMRAPASHLELPDLEARPAETVGELQELGCEYGVIAWLDPSLYSTEFIARHTVDRLNQAADLLEHAGLKLAYHNHDFEFGPLGKSTLWDMILEHTDSTRVRLEIDVHWVRHAGLSPAALIRNCGARVALLHMKDTGAPSAAIDCAVGDGVEDWPAVLAAGRTVGIKWYIVEQERSAEMLVDLTRSIQYLRSAGLRGPGPRLVDARVEDPERVVVAGEGNDLAVPVARVGVLNPASSPNTICSSWAARPPLELGTSRPTEQSGAHAENLPKNGVGCRRAY
jgi:sugar phosphate isomerase/epimerase